MRMSNYIFLKKAEKEYLHKIFVFLPICGRETLSWVKQI